MRQLFLSTILLPALAVAAGQALAQETLEADVASPEAIVEAAYGALMRAPGENFQWDRFRLFLP